LDVGMSSTAHNEGPDSGEKAPVDGVLAEDVYYSAGGATLLLGDAELVLSGLPTASVDCCVTSVPYFGLRDYGDDDQIGLEESPKQYVDRLVGVFNEVRRVLKPRGTLWLNAGDSYYSGKGAPTGSDPKQAARRGYLRTLDRPGASWARPKNLLGIPWRIAFALQDEGWTLRNDNIWHKPNAMPEPVRDRLSNCHEYVFLLSSSRIYDFDLDPIRLPLKYPEAANTVGGKKRDGLVGASERRRGGAYGAGIYPEGMNPQDGMGALGKRRTASNPKGKNPGDVWSMSTRPHPGEHPAMFPIDLPARCIAAGCVEGGVVLDPFSGSGTTGLAAIQSGRSYVGIDLNPSYHDLAIERLSACGQTLFDPSLTGKRDGSNG
jgi:DNA modification methylase